MMYLSEAVGSRQAPVAETLQLGRVYAHLAELEALYPDFEQWYWGKVAPDLSDGRRGLFCEEQAGTLAGVIIAKRDGLERKLCTVWVDQKFRRTGVSHRIFKRAMKWLGTDRPMISIPHSRLHEFRGLLATSNFKQTQIARSYYRPGCDEYVFNGSLPLD
ncbi:GNAT family N-acetyltransferase [Microvirga terrae]|uniref:GNAT family N-acetyltransferase n=1 Tax=Microvirga terrae TaxID=2740529 RepID=UPI003D817CBA